MTMLEKHLTEGVVRRQVHPKYPELFIYNYTERATFERIWDDVTIVCRGLIAADSEVIARGYNKFHNLNTTYVPETMEENLPSVPPVVTQKLDGSMGILYYYDDQPWVATRGSFNSEQAQWATKWLRERVSDDLIHYLTVGDSHTMISEIIYPENRIVVDYDFVGLVLTGCVDKETGEEVDRSVLEEIGEAVDIPVVKVFAKSLSECAAEDNPNEEGYVLSYEREGTSPLKVKVKFAEYCRLQRILTGLNPKSIWEMLFAGSNEAIDAILNDPKMPSGFLEWFDGWVTKLRSEYSDIESRAKESFSIRPFSGQWASPHTEQADLMVRKAQALYFQKTPELCSVLFAMLDEKDYSGTIWKRLKPKATDTFKKDGE